MATYIKTLKEDNGDIVYPQTVTDAVYTSGGQSLETEISKYVTAEDIASTVADFGTVTGGMLDDGAVTSAKIDSSAVTTAKINNGAVTTAKLDDGAITKSKIDLSSVGGMVYLDTIDASTIPYTVNADGLALDIRKYFANNSTAANRPMVFDEIRLVFDVYANDTNTVHYIRFGRDGGASNTVCRNMLTLSSSVSWDYSDNTGGVFSLRIGTNRTVKIRPYGGSGTIPTEADNLTLVTVSDDCSPSFGSTNARINLNTLYRISQTANKFYLYQADGSTVSFSGNIRVFGIKYPTV